MLNDIVSLQYCSLWNFPTCPRAQKSESRILRFILCKTSHWCHTERKKGPRYLLFTYNHFLYSEPGNFLQARPGYFFYSFQRQVIFFTLFRARLFFSCKTRDRIFFWKIIQPPPPPPPPPIRISNGRPLICHFNEGLIKLKNSIGQHFPIINRWVYSFAMETRILTQSATDGPYYTICSPCEPLAQLLSHSFLK